MPRPSEANQHEINEVLSVITSALVGQFEMSNLLDQVVSTSMKTLNAEVCSIFLEDTEKEPGYITMRAGSGFAKPLVGTAKYQIGEGLTGFVARTGQKLNIHSREELEHFEVDGKRIWLGKHDSRQWPSGRSEFRNLIALPLRIKNQILGVIKAENKDRRVGSHFTDDDERYFETIANVVALAIENARLHERVEKQLKAIAAKASHRIGNQVINYDGIELDLKDEITRPVPDKQALKGICDRVVKTTQNLKRMIEEFKTYGRPLVLHKQPTGINDIIKDEAWHAHPPKGVTIRHELDMAVPALEMDAGRFAEAFKELFRNSLKAIGVDARSGTILVVTRRQEREVLVRIEDSGPGFPPNFPVFEPFQATSPESTGLGLATVKELIEAHGGTIRTAQSEVLDGACIEFRIPIGG